jgi:hypothetical protein
MSKGSPTICAGGCVAKCDLTQGRARCTQPPPQTTVKSRSASSSRAMRLTLNSRSKAAGASVRRSCFEGVEAGLAGQTVNVAVPIDTSKYMRTIRALDPVKKTARVQPGVVLDQLRTEAGKYQLTFGPDPATHTHNTLGGMLRQ